MAVDTPEEPSVRILRQLVVLGGLDYPLGPNMAKEKLFGGERARLAPQKNE